MKNILRIAFLLLSFLLANSVSYSQIEDIKNKSSENKNNSSNSNNNSSSSDSDIGSDIASGCMEELVGGCFEACFEVGCSFMVGFIGEYTSELYETKSDDPSILSLDLNANFALANHYAHGDNYTYVNYLPGLRANLVSFIIDYRYNILTEYGDTPNSFKSWHLDFAFNIVPDETFKIAFGMGLQREITSESTFHEYFLCSKIGLNSNKDYIDYDLRASYDYETSEFPFFETGARFNKSILEGEHLSTYISLGAIYQNYYTSHDIWAIRGGLIFNWH